MAAEPASQSLATEPGAIELVAVVAQLLGHLEQQRELDKPELGKQELGKQELGMLGLDKQEPGMLGLGKQEPGKPEPGKPEPGKPEPGKQALQEHRNCGRQLYRTVTATD